ncbi:hypothetical protein [Haladaptatus cibarius]|uniref:hypothetical protein n=1 Tax=Haladaptatus cibarius TaxID=453847 RepID=UPI0006795F35|nr:hypothetical protein [Haladaptatus cibarius]
MHAATHLHKTFAIGLAIQSRYGHHSAYRQLFESREDKQEEALTPSIDANEPYGNLIGNVVFVGAFNSKKAAFANQLRKRLQTPDELRDDAPEFAIEIPVVTDHDRSAYATAVQRMCRERNLTPTREAGLRCVRPPEHDNTGGLPITMFDTSIDCPTTDPCPECGGFAPMNESSGVRACVDCGWNAEKHRRRKPDPEDE